MKSTTNRTKTCPTTILTKNTQNKTTKETKAWSIRPRCLSWAKRTIGAQAKWVEIRPEKTKIKVENLKKRKMRSSIFKSKSKPSKTMKSPTWKVLKHQVQMWLAKAKDFRRHTRAQLAPRQSLRLETSINRLFQIVKMFCHKFSKRKNWSYPETTKKKNTNWKSGHRP